MGKVQLCRGVVQEEEVQDRKGKRRLHLSISSEAEEESEGSSKVEAEEEVVYPTDSCYTTAATQLDTLILHLCHGMIDSRI